MLMKMGRTGPPLEPRRRPQAGKSGYPRSQNTDNMSYGQAPLVNGLFLMNLERDVTHIYSVNAKRCKVDNDSPTYLWHCHLAHIGVKRMKKLHADGLLDSLDYESFDTCEPCLMGKMTKTPFSGTMERATNLLESYILMCAVQ